MEIIQETAEIAQWMYRKGWDERNGEISAYGSQRRIAPKQRESRRCAAGRWRYRTGSCGERAFW